jgi:plastocyanin
MRGSAFALTPIVVLAVLGLSAATDVAVAQELNLVIRDHKFEPEELRVPAGKRVSIYVSNEDPRQIQGPGADRSARARPL